MSSRRVVMVGLVLFAVVGLLAFVDIWRLQEAPGAAGSRVVPFGSSPVPMSIQPPPGLRAIPFTQATPVPTLDRRVHLDFSKLHLPPSPTGKYPLRANGSIILPPAH